MESRGAADNKLKELMFFSFWGLVLVCSAAVRLYVKYNDWSDIGLRMNYAFLVRPLLSVSIALLAAGFLTKAGLIVVRHIAPNLKKTMFIAGLILTGVVVFYILLMNGTYMGNHYIKTDNWLKAAINGKFYYTLMAPFRSLEYYKEAFLFRDIAGTIGAIFIFMAKTKLGNSRKEEGLNASTTKSGGQGIFIVMCGIILLCSVIFGLYAEHSDPSGEFNILLKTTYLFLVKPLIYISAALLIGGIMSKTGLLDVKYLSEKKRKIFFAVGIVLLSFTVFYMLLLGGGTGLQYSEADNGVKDLVHTKQYLVLTHPFFNYLGEEMLFILNFSGALGAFFLFVTQKKFRLMKI